MSWLTAQERRSAEALGAIGYSNPFSKERMDLERQALGPDYVSFDFDSVIHRPPNPLTAFPNVPLMRAKAERLANKMRDHLLAGKPVDEAGLLLYEKLVLYVLYSRYNSTLEDLSLKQLQTDHLTNPTPQWQDFKRDHTFYLQLPDRSFPLHYEKAHIFATFFQIQRAFYLIFQTIFGRSMAIAEMRAAVWDSIFTHDMHRYARTLYKKMDHPTLIQGPSGTGKELIAKAICLSRYVAFDSKNQTFISNQSDEFIAINLSALAPGLIESELFGHCKGAFAYATADRQGYLELSKPHTCVFLDEIGETDLTIQVKLLRVLQTRDFQRVGETQTRKFHGKIIAATNRSLLEEIKAGRFREDLFYRLCGDMIHTPSLGEQLSQCPEDLEMLVRLHARDIIGEDDAEVDRLTEEVVMWVKQHLGTDYGWPGNFRELEQCIRNVMIRGSYTPSQLRTSPAPHKARRQLAEQIANAELKLPEVVQHYTSLVYAIEGGYRSAGEHLNVNWRTVKAQISPNLVEQYRETT